MPLDPFFPGLVNEMHLGIFNFYDMIYHTYAVVNQCDLFALRAAWSSTDSTSPQRVMDKLVVN